MRRDGRVLGMDRAITRRDFLNGAAMAVTGAALTPPWRAATAAQPVAAEPGAAYPPALTGMRGSHEGSYEVAHALRDAGRWRDPGPVADTGEVYDLVVVGAGLSGLAAAHFFRGQVGPQARVLLLESHDDFGGHATRNEFRIGDRTLLMNGGTLNIEDFGRYGEVARGLIHDLGIDVARYGEFVDDELYASLGLRRGVFFDRETFGADRLVLGERELDWREFLAGAPLSPQAREDIARLYDEKVDYMPDLSLDAKRRALLRMTYLEFLRDFAGVDEDALRYFQSQPYGYWAVGSDAISAWALRESGYPGFRGMGLPDARNLELIERNRSGRYFRFPDGNACIARLLVRSMIPGVAPGTGMEDIVTARFDYAQLDREGAPVRLRLGSTAVRVENVGDEGAPQHVEVTYVRGGAAQRVRARHCVLACYHAMIPYLCPQIPVPQKEALSCALRAPLVYTSVLIRNWEPFQRLKLREAFCPGGYHCSVRLGDPVSMGSYRCPRRPEEPMVLQLIRIPIRPGRPAPEQWKAGRRELLTTTFETFEYEIRDQLGRMLSAGGFDPARDIQAITVNRWPHGYAFGYDPATGEVAWGDEWPEGRRTWQRARRRFGRIAIANSDAAANAMTESAFGEAHRAVQELVASSG
ncbi:MAG TPA: NAD(P)-binding protein [Myxococcota bacterium]